jgi:hypothetical protein
VQALLGHELVELDAERELAAGGLQAGHPLVAHAHVGERDAVEGDRGGDAVGDLVQLGDVGGGDGDDELVQLAAIEDDLAGIFRGRDVGRARVGPG